MIRRFAISFFISAIVQGFMSMEPVSAQCSYGLFSGPEHGFLGISSGHSFVQWDPDGNGPLDKWLVIGGEFSYAGHLQANRVVAWDGTRFHRLGNGMESGIVRCLAVFEGQLIAGGDFGIADGVPVGGVARWEGQHWVAMDNPFQGGSAYAYAFAEFNGQLIMGTEYGVYRWDGNQWIELEKYGPYQVRSLIVYDGELVAGGSFAVNNDSFSYGIAKWSGTEWKALGTGMLPYSGGVFSLAVQGNDLIAGGLFSKAGGLQCKSLARWNGQTWSPIEHQLYGFYGSSPIINSMVVSCDRLLVGGSYYGYTTDYDISLNIMEFRDGEWHALDHGLTSTSSWVRSIAEYRSDIFATGSTLICNDLACDDLARWDGKAWLPLGSGLTIAASSSTWPVSSVCIWHEKLVMTGQITQAGSKRVDGIVLWNGATFEGLPWLFPPQHSPWSPPTTIHASTVHGDDLVVGGSFGLYSSPRNIARFDGSAWQPIGDGLQSKVVALYNHDDQLIAASDSELSPYYGEVHLWDDHQWNRIGNVGSYLNPYDTVNQLGSYHGDLIAAGYFKSIGPVSIANSIAAWNGSNWRSLSSGLVTSNGSYGSVFSIVEFEGGLVVGGYFQKAGGVVVNNIAKWSGSEWQAFGSGLYTVVAVAVQDGTLLASTGPTPAIARWNGVNWEDGIGPFMSNYPTQIVKYHDDVFLMGIDVSGAQNNSVVHAWTRYGPLGPMPLVTQQPSSPRVCQNSAVSLRATATGDGSLSYHWRRSGVDLVDNDEMIGTQSNTLVFLHPKPSDTDNYDCVIKLNDCTQTTSNAAALSVFPGGSADINGDFAVDSRDIAPFVQALINHDPVSVALCAADLSGEGIVNEADVEPFVNRLLAN
ncbi:MAG: hypothetical protein AABZ08_12300 [Planctomycetota bacterium]